MSIIDDHHILRPPNGVPPPPGAGALAPNSMGRPSGSAIGGSTAVLPPNPMGGGAPGAGAPPSGATPAATQPFFGSSGNDFTGAYNASVQEYTHFAPNNPRVNPDGSIQGPNGEVLYQVGGFYRPDRTDGLHFDHVTDDSQVTYDPEFGYVTTAANLSRNDGTFFDQYGGWLLAAPAIGAAGGAALAGTGGGAFAGGAAAGEIGTDAFAGAIAEGSAGMADAITSQIGQMIDTTLLPQVTAPTLPGLDPIPNFAPPPGVPGMPEYGAPPPAGGPSGGAPPEGTPPPGGGPAPVTDATTVPGTNPGTTTPSWLTPNNLLRAAGTVATIGALGGHHASSPGGGTLQNVVNDNKPLGDDARTTLTNHGAPTVDQRAAIDATIDQQWQQGQEAIIQQSINAGQGGKESMVVGDKLRAFKTALETQRQQLYMKQAEQNMLMALKELGLVTEAQFLLAQHELQQDTAAQQRASSIMQSLGWLFNMGGTGG